MIKVFLYMFFIFSYLNIFALDNLVTKDFILRQKKLTKILKLKNGIPVVYKKMENTEVLSLAFVINYGYKDIEYELKESFDLMLDIMPQATQKYSKDKIKELTEQYNTYIKCKVKNDFSLCFMNTINDFFTPMFDVFASVIKAPLFLVENFNIAKTRYLYSLKSELESPFIISDELAASLFYTSKHPYFKPTEQSIVDLEKSVFDNMSVLYQKLINSKDFFITVVTSLDEQNLIKSLENKFGDLKYTKNKKYPKIVSAKYDPNNHIKYKYRDLPVTYVTIYFEIPSYVSDSRIPLQFMLNILQDRLFENIRTDKNLVYTISLDVSFYKAIGVGKIIFSSSNWKLVLDEVYKNINLLKKSKLSIEEFDNYKVEYVTSYYSSLETSSSLMQALIRNFYYFKAFKLYDIPFKINKLKFQEAQKVYNKFVKDFRIGILTPTQNNSSTKVNTQN